MKKVKRLRKQCIVLTYGLKLGYESVLTALYLMNTRAGSPTISVMLDESMKMTIIGLAFVATAFAFGVSFTGLFTSSAHLHLGLEHLGYTLNPKNPDPRVAKYPNLMNEVRNAIPAYKCMSAFIPLCFLLFGIFTILIFVIRVSVESVAHYVIACFLFMFFSYFNSLLVQKRYTKFRVVEIVYFANVLKQRRGMKMNDPEYKRAFDSFMIERFGFSNWRHLIGLNTFFMTLSWILSFFFTVMSWTSYQPMTFTDLAVTEYLLLDINITMLLFVYLDIHLTDLHPHEHVKKFFPPLIIKPDQ